MKVIVKYFALFLCLFLMNQQAAKAQIIVQDIINLRVNDSTNEGNVLIHQPKNFEKANSTNQENINRNLKLPIWTIVGEKGNLVLDQSNISYSEVQQVIRRLPIGHYEVRKNNRLITRINKS